MKMFKSMTFKIIEQKFSKE